MIGYCMPPYVYDHPSIGYDFQATTGYHQWEQAMSGSDWCLWAMNGVWCSTGDSYITSISHFLLVWGWACRTLDKGEVFSSLLLPSVRGYWAWLAVGGGRLEVEGLRLMVSLRWKAHGFRPMAEGERLDPLPLKFPSSRYLCIDICLTYQEWRKDKTLIGVW